MECQIIRKDLIFPNLWSGGKTYELFIYPQCSVYHARDFVFRISTASIENDESEFTSLPGFSRDIMPLTGNLLINHHEHYSKNLSFPEVDSFMGDWITHSKGVVHDFNLIMSKNALGSIGGFDLCSGETKSFKSHKIPDFLLFYMFNGEASIKFGNENINVKSGDVLIFSKFTSIEEIAFHAHHQSRIAFAQVQIL